MNQPPKAQTEPQHAYLLRVHRELARAFAALSIWHSAEASGIDPDAAMLLTYKSAWRCINGGLKIIAADVNDPGVAARATR